MTTKLLFFSLLLSSFFLSSQSSTKENQKTYISFDKYLGVENIDLSNGIIEENEYRSIYNNNHQFFKSLDFLPGSVHYNNQSYFGLSLKYNIYEDEVLVKLPNKYGAVTLKLLKSKVENFVIDSHKFIRVDSVTSTNDELKGFYEVLLEKKNVVLYKKYDQAKRDVIENRKVFYHFLNKNSYILYYKDVYYKVNTKNALSKILPDHKKTIRNFYTKNKALYKLKPDSFMTSLVRKVYSEISRTNNKVTE